MAPRQRPPQRVGWPLSPAQVEAIDEQFFELYKRVSNLEGAAPSVAGSTARTISFGIVIDGGGSTLTTGIKGDLTVPVACVIQSVVLLADQSGSVVVDIWKDTFANYPPTIADTITASAKPTISAALDSEDTTLTGWTLAVSAGDTLRFNVDSVSTITRLTLSLKARVP